ncbi:MAG: hypothetical protein Q8936_23330 [Bacillota bacterium]|nr:hypothetical protein [Bacillota bacterium]
MEYCEICLEDDIYKPGELHHIVFRSKCKPLENCKLNHIHLCYEHHRGTNGVHGRLGHVLDKKLKLRFQNNLEILFCQNYFTLEDVMNTLGISFNNIRRLSKRFKCEKGYYTRESIIRACMSDKMIIEGYEEVSK